MYTEPWVVTEQTGGGPGLYRRQKPHRQARDAEYRRLGLHDRAWLYEARGHQAEMIGGHERATTGDTPGCASPPAREVAPLAVGSLVSVGQDGAAEVLKRLQQRPAPPAPPTPPAATPYTVAGLMPGAAAMLPSAPLPYLQNSTSFARLKR